MFTTNRFTYFMLIVCIIYIHSAINIQYSALINIELSGFQAISDIWLSMLNVSYFLIQNLILAGICAASIIYMDSAIMLSNAN